MESDRWLTELMKIANIQGLTRSDGVEAREKAVKQWVEDWIGEYSFEQTIIKKDFSLEEMEFLKYHSAKCMSEILMEDCVYMNLNENKLRVKTFCLKKDK